MDELLSLIAPDSMPDIIALAAFLLGWIGYTVVTERLRKAPDHLLNTMDRYRTDWMRRMLARDNRMVDAALLGNLLRSIAFFASTSILILLGLTTLFRYREEVSSILDSLPYAATVTPMLWDAKILLLIVIFIYAFFKFTWSLRLYNYACILVGSAPQHNATGVDFERIAVSGGLLTVSASRNFNLGLRACYFGLAALAWFIHPWLLILSTVFVICILYRREFHATPLLYLYDPEQQADA